MTLPFTYTSLPNICNSPQFADGNIQNQIPSALGSGTSMLIAAIVVDDGSPFNFCGVVAKWNINE